MTELTPDLAYSPSHFASDFEATLTRQAAAGHALRVSHQPLTLSYGDDPAACLHLFIPSGEGPWPLMVFIHGGYWQQLDHTATDFLAERYLARGMAFASLGYGLAPNTTIDTMMTQCTQGLEAAYHAIEANGGTWSVTLGGHSAGAQLAYWVAISGKVPIDKLVLVSGVYDLTPLVDTYINEPLGLTRTQARELSPQFGELVKLPPSQIVIAENDPPTFHQQGHNFLALLHAANVQAALVELPKCDHFDVLEYL
ncbi:MAG: alpha/beta hydrolase [Halomonas sp.]|nr:alpha/beta hydrolase [Halomonas sp.]MBP5981163.1 alpha/beta hydrolase [Halomonas sp.]